MQEQKLRLELDVPMPMRDGTVLHADIYRPDTLERCPTVVLRLPYNKSNPVLNVSFDPIRIAKNGYVLLFQDCRGTSSSDGKFCPFISEVEAKDGYDTVEWAAKQSWSNGKVGMYGNSYHAFTQWAAAREQPPHLVVIFPAAIGPGARDLWFAGGAFQIHAALMWGFHMSLLNLLRNPPPPQERVKLMGNLFRAFDNLTEEATFLPLKELPSLKSSGFSDFYFDMLEHPGYDMYWQEREWASYERTVVPAYLRTGWYDCTLRGTLSCYKGMMERGGSGKARKNTKLIIGPWIHHPELSQQVGEIDFGLGAAGATLDIVGVQLRWFDYWLKDINNGVIEEPPVRIFVMGDNGWRYEKEWPLARAKYKRYYLHSGGRANTCKGDGILTLEVPVEEEYDSYVYDPRNPAPTRGGNILTLAGGAGAFDQREVEERKDVLVYTTPQLEEDLEVTGPVQVNLFASSSARDTDFTAKLVDVWLNGKAYILADGIIRARYRLSDTKQSLIEPGKVYEYTIDVGATSNVFKAGHRIGVEISSSNFPRYDRNPNTGHACGEDAELELATQRVFHDKNHPSHIVLPVIPR